MNAKESLLLACATILSGLAGWALRGHARSGGVSPITHSRSAPAPAPWSVTSHASLRPAWEALTRQYRDEAQLPEARARLYSLFRDLPGEDFARAIAELAAGGEVNGENPGVLLAGMWAERDLPAARDWVLSVKSSPAYAQAVFATWARQDLHGMLAWVEANAGQLAPSPTLAGVLAAVSQIAAESSPEAGLQLLDRLGGKAADQEKMNLYMNWARLDPAAAMACAASEPTESASLAALRSVASDLGRLSQHVASEFAAQMPNRTEATTVLIALADGISEKSPQAAVIFLDAQAGQSDRLRIEANRHLSLWASEDGVAALRWAVDEGSDDALTQTLQHVEDGVNETVWEELPPAKRGRIEGAVRKLAAQGKTNPLE